MMQLAWLVLALWRTGIVSSGAIHQYALLDMHSSTQEQARHVMSINDTPMPSHVLVQKRSNSQGEMPFEYIAGRGTYFKDPAWYIHEVAEREFQSSIFFQYWICIHEKYGKLGYWGDSRIATAIKSGQVTPKAHIEMVQDCYRKSNKVQGVIDNANPEMARIRKAKNAFEMKRREVVRVGVEKGNETKRRIRQDTKVRATAWSSTDETGDSAEDALTTPELTQSEKQTRRKGNGSQGTPDVPNCDDHSRSTPDQVCGETDDTQKTPETIGFPLDAWVSEEERMQEAQRHGWTDFDETNPTGGSTSQNHGWTDFDETNPTGGSASQKLSQFSRLPFQQTQRYLQNQLNNLPAKLDQWGNDARMPFQNYFKQDPTTQSAVGGFPMPHMVSPVGAIP